MLWDAESASEFSWQDVVTRIIPPEDGRDAGVPLQAPAQRVLCETFRRHIGTWYSGGSHPCARDLVDTRQIWEGCWEQQWKGKKSECSRRGKHPPDRWDSADASVQPGLRCAADHSTKPAHIIKHREVNSCPDFLSIFIVFLSLWALANS